MLEFKHELYCHKLLGLDSLSRWTVVRAAYKQQALKNHPDKVSPDLVEAANEKMKKINWAYEVLRFVTIIASQINY